MTPTKWDQVRATLWDQVRAMFGVKSPKRFRQTGLAVERAQALGSQSETQTDGPVASDKSTVDSLESPPALHRAPPHKASHALPFGQIVAGRFEILRFINSGGMGEVYEAWDSELRERIALKTIRPEAASSPSVIERFKREVKRTRVISQLNVCRVYEVFSHTQDSMCEGMCWACDAAGAILA